MVLFPDLKRLSLVVTVALLGFSKGGPDALGVIPPVPSSLFQFPYHPLSQVPLVSLSTPLKIFCPMWVFPLLPYSFACALSPSVSRPGHTIPLYLTQHVQFYNASTATYWVPSFHLLVHTSLVCHNQAGNKIMKSVHSLLPSSQNYIFRQCTKPNSTDSYLCKRAIRYLQRVRGSWVSEKLIFTVLTNNWPSCAPVECVFQSHGALYQSSHFLFHR